MSDSVPAGGAQFTLSATVSNGGEGAAAATMLRYYRSTDVTITTTDTEVGTDAIGELAAAGSSSQSVELTAPATPATYYYGACVDPVTDESDTTNNCSDSVEVTVPEPERPDLVVTAPAASDVGPTAGAQFTLSATVRNDGEGIAAATTLRYYQSTDTTITTSDTSLGTVAIAGLAGSGSSSQLVKLTAPANPGTYYYGACVDAVPDESDTANNCSDSVPLTVAQKSVGVTPREVTLAALGDTAALTARVLDAQGNEIPGEPVSWSSNFPEVATVDAAGVVTAVVNGRATVTASASGATGAATVIVDQRVVSVDIDPGEVELTSVGDTAALTLRAFDANGHEVPDAGDIMSFAWRSADLDVAIVSSLFGLTAQAHAAGAGTTTVTVTAVTADGGRLSGTATVTVTVTVTEEGKPDLEILSIETLVDGVGNTYPLESFQVEASVLNDGDGPSEATTLRIYRSADTTVDASDTEVGTAPVAGLAASEDADTALRVRSPLTSGTYFYGACVDAVAGESDTSNNCSSAARVTVAEPGRPPDLVVVSPSISDSSPNAGAEFTLSATVRNRGEGPSAATTLRYYLSSNDRISTGAREVGMAAVAGLAAGGESRQSATLAAPTEVRTYYYGACVDTVPRESEPYNNCSPAVPLVPRRPDLVVRSPSISKTELDTGEEFTLSATVHNQGDGDAAATTLRYYLARLFHTTYADNEVGADAVAELVPAGSSEKSLTRNAPTDARAKHFYRACVDAAPHETDKRNNCTAWVRYYLSNPQGSPNLVPVAFLPSVGNYGDRKSAPTTLRWYVTTDSEPDSDETGSPIFTPENEIRTYAVGEIYPWSMSSDSLSPPPAPEKPGYYQDGLCVDPVPGETERLDNCLSAYEMEFEVR